MSSTDSAAAARRLPGLADLARLLRAATRGPAYEAAAADLRDVRIAGLALPVRATVVLFIVTAALVLDATERAVLPLVGGIMGEGDPVLNLALERAILFGALPLLVVTLGFRDRPARFGLTLGDWRWGAGLLVAGLVVMTPIIAWFSGLPDFSAYYGTVTGSIGQIALRNGLEVIPAEFLFRGFLMFVLLRRIGPLAIVIVQVPFVMAHIGKPEIELWSTFLGGSIFAWLDWRTGSVVWSALGHLYVLTLMVVLARGLLG
ncbi:MAG: CPBP family intramembrane metalloprotease [Chloroflexi bacterium]|nr:CPBP family intramembrane metalloprotease [Chloroflexota bacterium]